MAVYEGQATISSLTGQGILELDVSNEVMLFKPEWYPLQTRLNALNRVRYVSNLKGFQFNVMPEVKRTYAIDSSANTNNPIPDDTTIYVVSATGLQIGDVITIPQGGLTNSSSFDLQSRVITAIDGNKLTLDSAMTGISSVTIAASDADEIYKSSSAAGDGSVSKSMVMPQMLTGNNNCQQIRKSIDISNNELLVEKNYVNVKALYRQIAVSDFMTDFENALFFGKGQSAATDAESKVIYTMQGFYTAMLDPTASGFNFQIGSEKATGAASSTGYAADGSDFTYDALINFLSSAMTYGSSSKDFYVDGWLMNKIGTLNQPSFRTYKNDKETLGMEVTEVIVPGKGVVNIIYNPVFDKGIGFKGGILIDPNYVNLCIYRDTQARTNIQENDRDGEKSEIMGTKSIEFGRLEAHGYLTHL